MNYNIEELFFELLRVAIGNAGQLSFTPNKKEWEALYTMAEKQSLIGVCFAGIRRLGADAGTRFANIGMDRVQYLTWMGMAAKIQQRNELMNRCTDKAVAYFRKNGLPCAAMKGQEIAKKYGDLALLRQSGDIDLWIGGGRRKLYEFSVRKFGQLEGLRYHHIHFQMFDDVDVEAHNCPSYHSSPILNRRFKKFYRQYEPSDAEWELPIAFNRVFIMEHAFQHFCWHGIGLRHVMDYYFVLQQGFSETERKETLYWIEQLGMMHFARGLMWVLRYVLGMENRFMLCEPDAKDGAFVLSEIMQSGNLGHYDSRENSRLRQTSLGRYLFSLRRSVRMAKYNWQFMLFNPFVKLYMFVWQRKTIRKWGII